MAGWRELCLKLPGLGRQILRLKIIVVTLLPLECERKEKQGWISFVIDRSGFDYTSMLSNIFYGYNSDEVYIEEMVRRADKHLKI